MSKLRKMMASHLDTIILNYHHGNPVAAPKMLVIQCQLKLNRYTTNSKIKNAEEPSLKSIRFTKDWGGVPNILNGLCLYI